jgi:hypothetical protein
MKSITVRFIFTPFILLAILFLMLLFPAGGHAGAQGFPTIKEKTKSMEKQEGFIPLYYDRMTGRLYLEVSLPGEDFLYDSFIASGVGLVFQRGIIWNASYKIVHFERHGPRLLLITKNIQIQSLAPRKPDMGTFAEDVFPVFSLGSFPIVAEEDNLVLVDGTDHFLQDISNIPGRANTRIQGKSNFRLDLKQSSIYRPRTRSFPESTEIEALLAFVPDQPLSTLLVRVRHSLCKFPAPGFTLRRRDLRMGFQDFTVMDPSRSSMEDSRNPYLKRWRLEKRDPEASVSDVIKPLVFFIDSAMPENVRKAAKLGIEYWNQVFNVVGFRNAIQVRDLPKDADPWDRRFPIVVLWSQPLVAGNGACVMDPRTGEFLKGIINLDGYQERVEANTYKAFQPALEPGQPDLETTVLARRIWQVAHEAGHVLAAMYHNMLSPTVMGFPRPRFQVGQSGRIKMDLSVVLPSTPYPYDVWMIRYAYTMFNPSEEEEGLLRIVEEGLQQGLRNAPYSPNSNPRSSVRIHNEDPLTVLKEDMDVRRVLLDRVGPDVLYYGEPKALLFERLIPVYFHHRHAIRAVVKMLGGVEFTYGLKGDNLTPTKVIDPREQRRALEALLKALSPEELLIPSKIVPLIPPRYKPSELEWPIRKPGVFQHMTGYGPPIRIPLSPGGVFNPIDWARALSRLIISDLLMGDRLARVAVLEASGQSDLSVEEILDQIISKSWGAPVPDNPVLAGLQRAAQSVVLDKMLSLAQDDRPPLEVKEPLRAKLHNLLEDLRKRKTEDPAEKAHQDAAIRLITEIF